MNIETKEFLGGFFTFILFLVVIALGYFIWNEFQAETKERKEQSIDNNVSQVMQEDDTNTAENTTDENEENYINEEENIDVKNDINVQDENVDVENDADVQYEENIDAENDTDVQYEEYIDEELENL